MPREEPMEVMSGEVPHIGICICTYKRPDFLRHLLQKLATLETGGRFSWSVVVADNDADESAREVVAEAGRDLTGRVTYCVQPEQNIALTRNEALANSTGEYIAVLDVDEFPESCWLLTMYETCVALEADGVLGPVLPYFETDPPSWIVKGGFCDRPRHRTGHEMEWSNSRTGNLLFRRVIIEDLEEPFRPEFGSGGEDRDFFRRMIAVRRRFVWCDEAPVYEWVPPVRLRKSFMLRRALLRGKVSLNNRSGLGAVAKSAVAIILYSLALPFALFLGQHQFMDLLIRICDHGGMIMAKVGIDPVRETYVTE